MKKFSLAIYVLFTLTTGFYGCSKSNSTLQQQQPQGTGVCKVQSIDMVASPNVDIGYTQTETAYFTYNNNQFSELNMSVVDPYYGNVKDKYTYYYSGNDLAKFKHETSYVDPHDNQPTYNLYSNYITYNTNGNVSLIKTDDESTGKRVDSTIFSYDGSKRLTKVEYYHWNASHIGPMYYNYESLTYSGNQLKIMTYDGEGKLTGEYTCSYGTSKNELKKIKDLLFIMNGSIIPYYSIYGFNNDYLPTTLNYVNHDGSAFNATYNFTYTFNSNGLPTKIMVNGTTILNFNFDCN